MSAWLREDGDGALVLSVHVQPGAKQTGFAGRYGDALKLRLAAPPVDGKANAALCRFLAEYCGVAKSSVTLVSGQSSRAKRVRIVGINVAARARLAALGDEPE
ncbi:MAG: YggU family protein [Rhodocyclales bacterium]|nr:YggU family protein [Rhodocyclales bacterium]